MNRRRNPNLGAQEVANDFIYELQLLADKLSQAIDHASAARRYKGLVPDIGLALRYAEKLSEEAREMQRVSPFRDNTIPNHAGDLIRVINEVRKHIDVLNDMMPTLEEWWSVSREAKGTLYKLHLLTMEIIEAIVNG